MKVWPKNDDVRRLITHPHGNIAFRAEGPSDWPDDSFTHRRIADGDVTTEDPGQQQGEEPRVAPTEGPDKNAPGVTIEKK